MSREIPRRGRRSGPVYWRRTSSLGAIRRSGGRTRHQAERHGGIGAPRHDHCAVPGHPCPAGSAASLGSVTGFKAACGRGGGLFALGPVPPDPPPWTGCASGTVGDIRSARIRRFDRWGTAPEPRQPGAPNPWVHGPHTAMTASGYRAASEAGFPVEPGPSNRAVPFAACAAQKQPFAITDPRERTDRLRTRSEAAFRPVGTLPAIVRPGRRTMALPTRPPGSPGERATPS